MVTYNGSSISMYDILSFTRIIYNYITMVHTLKPGVHTDDFAPISGRRAKKLGHASLATVFRHGRFTSQPILWENLESPVLRYQPITTAVITDYITKHQMAPWCIYITERRHQVAALRDSLGLDRVVRVYVE